ncbi:hypothetical protein [Helicobacter sp. T3_23-1056]
MLAKMLDGVSLNHKICQSIIARICPNPHKIRSITSTNPSAWQSSKSIFK